MSFSKDRSIVVLDGIEKRGLNCISIVVLNGIVGLNGIENRDFNRGIEKHVRKEAVFLKGIEKRVLK
jgi:hypothetical protein